MLQGNSNLSRFDQDIRSVLFVGDHRSFSNLYLGLIQDEFPDFKIVWDPRLTDAEHRVSILRNQAAIIVVSCKFGSLVLPTIERLSQMAPNAQFVLAYETAEDIRASVQGSMGLSELAQFSFLPMRSKIETSIFILHLLNSGEQHVSGEVIELLMELSAEPAHGAIGAHLGGDGFDECPLTARETEVMGLLSYGAPNKSIAAGLGLSESTVKLHIHNIIEKLGVNNRTEAAVFYLTGRAGRTKLSGT